MARQILLADDSVTIQKVVELTFMEGDYRLQAVSDGDEALRQLEQARPDLVIADVHMPGANGYEVCRAVKAKYSDVPVLLLIGTFEAFNPEDAAECGADSHLKKPFDSQALLSLVEELLPSEVPGEVGNGASQDGSSQLAGPEVSTEPAEAAEAPETGAGAARGEELSDELVERVARRLAELLAPDVVREVAWEVVPDLAEVVVRERLRELEEQVE
jgi:CheY-like chemotaxis protein